MQRSQSIVISRIDGTLPFFQQGLDDRDRTDCCSPMKRQLTPDVFDAGTALIGE